MARKQLTDILRNDIEAYIAQNKELMFNERDLQVRIATALRDSRHYDDVDMEYAVPLKELTKRKLNIEAGKYPWKNDLSIDVVVRLGREFAAVELKYATRPVDTNITRFGEEMKTDSLIIKDQAASDIIMYNYWKDVKRIETLRENYPAVEGGIALIITNNTSYWRKPQPESSYRAFSTYEGNTVGGGKLDWLGQISNNVTSSHPAFELRGTYPCHWEDTAVEALTAKGREKVPFRYMLTVIK